MIRVEKGLLRRIQLTLCAKHIENKLFTIKTL